MSIPTHKEEIKIPCRNACFTTLACSAGYLCFSEYLLIFRLMAYNMDSLYRKFQGGMQPTRVAYLPV